MEALKEKTISAGSEFLFPAIAINGTTPTTIIATWGLSPTSFSALLLSLYNLCMFDYR
jgi:hypothetical protein